MNSKPSDQDNRKTFIKKAAVVLAASGYVGNMAQAKNKSLDQTLNLGLIGAGGRGTGAVLDAFRADANVKLTAIADMFPDRAERSLKILKSKVEDRVAVEESHVFTGFDAYKKCLDTDVDVVILATPPHFRPLHIEECVKKKVHMFVEKPVAVDAPGVRRVFKACEEARKLNLSVVSGLCWRYDEGVKATIAKIREGAIGRVLATNSSFNSSTTPQYRRKPNMTDMEWQLRSWFYHRWLSGDHILEQAVHTIDKMMWAFGDARPLSAYGTGGRIVRTDKRYGNIYDHFSIVYTFPDEQMGFFNCRQMKGTDPNVSDVIMGTEGNANLIRHFVTGKNRWRFKNAKENMFTNEHKALFKGIRDAKPINNGQYMTESTLAGLMGRMSAYTGKKITYQQALNSKEDFTPENYEFGPLTEAPVALPGITPFS